MARLGFLLAFLGSAWATAALPGDRLTLAFPGLPPGPLQVEAPGFEVLYASPEAASGLALVALRVPPTLAAGSHPVCLTLTGTRICQEVHVLPRRALGLDVPEEASPPELEITLFNRGNVPLNLVLHGEGDVEIASTPVRLEAGASRRLRLALQGVGRLLLRVSGDWEEARLIQVRPPGGAPLPYRLQGVLEAGFRPQGAYAGAYLEGPLARDLSVGARLGWEGWGLAVRKGPYGLSLDPSEGVGLAYEGETLQVRGAYGPSGAYLGGTYRDGTLYLTAAASTQGLALGYADGTHVVQATLRPGPPPLTLRLLRLGTPYFYGEYGGYLRLGVGELWPGTRLGLRLENGGLSLEGSYTGGLPGLSYSLAGSVGTANRLEASFGVPLPPLVLVLQGGVGTGGGSWGLGAGVREGPLTLYASLEGGTSLRGVLLAEWREGPLSLGLEAGSLGFAFRGAYRYNLPVPPEATLALGGYDRALATGRVYLQGRPLPGVRLTAPGAEAETDGNGHFHLWVPREGAKVAFQPPPSVLALALVQEVRPGSGLEVSLPPASLVRLRCEGAPPQEATAGLYLLGPGGSLLLACGQEAVLPPGAYRLLPQLPPGYNLDQKPQDLDLAPEEERLLTLTLIPPSPQGANQPRGFRVQAPEAAAPGEEVELEVTGVGDQEARLQGPGVGPLTAPGPVARLRFQVPWEARGSLPLRVQVGQEVQTLLLPIEDRPLLLAELQPRRAAPGQEVRVILATRFPATEAFLNALGERVRLVREASGRFTGTFRAPSRLEGLPLEDLAPGVKGLPMALEACQNLPGRGETRCLTLRLRLILQASPP